MKLKSIIAAAALAASAPVFAADAPPVVVFGYGNNTCAQAVESIEKDAANKVYLLAYVGGYVSGSAEQFTAVLSGRSPGNDQALRMWNELLHKIGPVKFFDQVMKVCSENPEASVKAAADSVLFEVYNYIVNALNKAAKENRAPDAQRPGTVDRLPNDPKNRNIL